MRNPARQGVGRVDLRLDCRFGRALRRSFSATRSRPHRGHFGRSALVDIGHYTVARIGRRAHVAEHDTALTSSGRAALHRFSNGTGHMAHAHAGKARGRETRPYGRRSLTWHRAQSANEEGNRQNRAQKGEKFHDVFGDFALRTEISNAVRFCQQSLLE